MDAAEAIGLVLNYLTAYHMLHRTANVRPGQRVLIHASRRGQLGTIAAWASSPGWRCTVPVHLNERRPLPTWVVSRLVTCNQNFVKEIHRLTSEGADVVLTASVAPAFVTSSMTTFRVRSSATSLRGCSAWPTSPIARAASEEQAFRSRPTIQYWNSRRVFAFCFSSPISIWPSTSCSAPNHTASVLLSIELRCIERCLRTKLGEKSRARTCASIRAKRRSGKRVANGLSAITRTVGNNSSLRTGKLDV